MSDAKLFRFNDKTVSELAGYSAKLEKDLQILIEGNMEAFLGIRFMETEYTTGKSHKGRVDTLGLDENHCPVIVEYKRHSNDNVINQGLFYLDWLLDHQAEFRWLVMEKFGKDVAEQIEWLGTRLICIASDFNKFDEHAVQQINRNIELMRYRFFDKDLLLLELVNAQTGTSDAHQKSSGASLTKAGTKYKEHIHQDKLEQASSELLKLYELVCGYIDGLGDEVQRKELKRYIAFKRIKNFACIVVYPTPQDSRLQLFLKVNPANFELEKGFSRDVTDLGHWGTGDLEVTIRSVNDFEKAKPVIDASYQGG